MSLSKNKGIWYNKIKIGEDAMKEYTAKEMKLLKANPYTFKVTKNKLYFTIKFKEAFGLHIMIRKRNSMNVW